MRAKPIKFHKLSVKKYNWTWQVRVPIKHGSTGVQNGCRVESGNLETECNWQVLLWIRLILSLGLWIGLILSLGLIQVKETSSSKWCRDSSLARFSMAPWLPFLYTWNVIAVVVQLLSRVQLFVTPWTAAHQGSLSLTISQSLPKSMSMSSIIGKQLIIACSLPNTETMLKLLLRCFLILWDFLLTQSHYCQTKIALFLPSKSV